MERSTQRWRQEGRASGECANSTVAVVALCSGRFKRQIPKVETADTRRGQSDGVGVQEMLDALVRHGALRQHENGKRAVRHMLDQRIVRSGLSF